jgi:DNA-binding TFAR19-related protein (PDSD5 family)
MTRDAYQRYANIRAANPENAVQVLVMANQYIERHKIPTLSDSDFRALLEHSTAKKREFKITRK